VSALWWLIIAFDYHGSAIQAIPMESEQVCYQAISKTYKKFDDKYTRVVMECVKGR